MYEYNVRIGFSQCDVNTILSITELIDLFQDASTFQSEDLGIGYDYLKKDNLAWVINYWELDIIRLPRMCETVTIGTAPYEFKGFLGHRNFWMKDDKGNYMVKANSLWTLMDLKALKPYKAPDELKQAYVLEEKLDMNYGSRKVLVPDEEKAEEKQPIQIQSYHLDGNNHVNNGQYIRMAMSEIEEDIIPTGLRTDFRIQAKLGDVIYPVVYKSENRWVIALNNSEGKPYSVTEIRGQIC